MSTISIVESKQENISRDLRSLSTRLNQPASDKMMMRQAEREVLDLITKFLQSSNEN
jgi:hypothetical protein